MTMEEKRAEIAHLKSLGATEVWHDDVGVIHIECPDSANSAINAYMLPGVPLISDDEWDDMNG